MIFTTLTPLGQCATDFPVSPFEDGVNSVDGIMQASLATTVSLQHPESSRLVVLSDRVFEERDALVPAARARLAETHDAMVSLCRGMASEMPRYEKAKKALDAARLKAPEAVIRAKEVALATVTTPALVSYLEARDAHLDALVTLLPSLQEWKNAERAFSASTTSAPTWRSRALDALRSSYTLRAKLVTLCNGSSLVQSDEKSHCDFYVAEEMMPVYVVRDLEDAAAIVAKYHDAETLERAIVVTSSSSRLSGGLSTNMRNELWRAARHVGACVGDTDASPNCLCTYTYERYHRLRYAAERAYEESVEKRARSEMPVDVLKRVFVLHEEGF